jgi:hypothetical protein
LGDRVPSQSVEVKFSNVLAKHTITAQPCGNIINLLRQLQVDLSSYLFSHLTVWQANLQGMNLHNVNEANFDLRQSVFSDILGNITSL